jgi:hypothetical protein
LSGAVLPAGPILVVYRGGLLDHRYQDPEGEQQLALDPAERLRLRSPAPRVRQASRQLRVDVAHPRDERDHRDHELDEPQQLDHLSSDPDGRLQARYGRSVTDLFDGCINISVGTDALAEFASDCARARSSSPSSRLSVHERQVQSRAPKAPSGASFPWTGPRTVDLHSLQAQESQKYSLRLFAAECSPLLLLSLIEATEMAHLDGWAQSYRYKGE